MALEKDEALPQGERLKPKEVEAVSPTKPKTISPTKIKDACPSCGIALKKHKCKQCGVTKTINSVSGQVMWMRGSRLIAAYRNEKHSYTSIAKDHKIPKNRWPKKFQEVD